MMKRLYVTAIIAGAMFFSVENATAQVNNENTQATTEQIEQKDDFQAILEQDLPNEVREALQRDHEGATVSEAYVKEKEGERKYKLVVNTQEGESKELYADAEGNWIDKDDKRKDSE